MLVNELVNSKSIALDATNNPSNEIPYLGLKWFPEVKRQSIDLPWVKTASGLPVSLAPSNYDTLPVLRARKGLAKERTKMAFFREHMKIDEEDVIEIDKIKDANDPYLESALLSVYDDTRNLVSGAEVVPERMRMQLLATTNGHPVIGVESDGVKYAYDFDPNGEYAAKHYMKLSETTDKWTDKKNSKPLDDLNKARKALNKIGKTPSYILMNSNTFELLLGNEQIKTAIIAQNPNGIVYMTDDLVKATVKALTKLEIVIYDKMFIDRATGKEEYFYPDNKVTLLPEATCGKTNFGQTPEERTARQVDNVDVSMYGTGIAVATKTDYGPPALTTVTAALTVIPSYENMYSTFVIDVA